MGVAFFVPARPGELEEGKHFALDWLDLNLSRISSHLVEREKERAIEKPFVLRSVVFVERSCRMMAARFFASSLGKEEGLFFT